MNLILPPIDESCGRHDKTRCGYDPHMNPIPSFWAFNNGVFHPSRVCEEYSYPFAAFAGMEGL